MACDVDYKNQPFHWLSSVEGLFYPLYVVCICNFAFVYSAWSKVARKRPVAIVVSSW